MKGTQIGMQLPPVVALRPDNFICHAGVVEALEKLRHVVNSLFSISSIISEPRAGCSHLAVVLQEEFLNSGRSVYSIEAQDIEKFLSEEFDESLTHERTVYILDDSDQYFKSNPVSGPFVSFVENCRYRGGHIFLFGHSSLESYPCDEHIMSRLYAGNTASIQFPGDDEYPQLILECARQRGISLSLWQAQYIGKRIGRGFDELQRYLHCLATVREQSSTHSIRSDINEALTVSRQTVS